MVGEVNSFPLAWMVVRYLLVEGITCTPVIKEIVQNMLC